MIDGQELKFYLNILQVLGVSGFLCQSLLQENPSPSHAEIEAAFDGNICRCTGFRAILDAMGSFAGSKDSKSKCQGQCGDIEV